MEFDLDFVVPRHCVPVGPDGLSPLQGEMIRNPARIRVFSAPTGGGKSYAFGRAVRDGARVLFVVPTRRLAQNLALEFAESFAGTDARVVLWTSDESGRLRTEEPDLDVRRLRIGQVRDLDEVDVGTMVLATPESVGLMLLGDRKRAADVPFYLRDLVNFHHVVFDEFHTISPRGFGLAGAICRLAVLLGANGPCVTFLSATPIDIKPTLTGLGIDAAEILVARETVETTDTVDAGKTRALHGDVRYRFATFVEGGIVGLVDAMTSEIRTCVERGSQAVVIFDSVESLFAAKERLAAIFDDIGVGVERRLSVNSWDDTGIRGIDRYFSVGRDLDPKAFDVVVGTSSIEVGVTLRSTFLIMDAGFDAASFIQRAGRIARRDESGEVVVNVPVNLDRKGWLTKAMAVLKIKGDRITVGEVEGAFLSGVEARFKPSMADMSDEVPSHFRTLSQRAVWCAALFWVAMSRARHLYKGQKDTLKDFQPSKTGLIQARLISLAQSGSPSAKAWSAAFLAEAFTFRDIAPTVNVVVPGGRMHVVPWRTYVSLPGLSSARVDINAKTNRITVHADRGLPEIVSDPERTHVRLKLKAMFPHSASGICLDAENAAEEWLIKAEGLRCNSILTNETKRAMEAAIDLVRLTRLVPEMRDELPAHEIEGSLVH